MTGEVRRGGTHGQLALPVAFAALAAFALWLLVGGAGEVHQFAGPTMGTTFSVTVDADMTGLEHERVETSIRGWLEDVDRVMSTFDPASELSGLNGHVGTEPVVVSRELLEVLATARDVSERSGGAFDVTVAPLVDAWGFGPGSLAPTTPDTALVAGLRERVGYRRIALDEVAGTVSKSHPQVQIDLSGIAKGHAVDRVSAGLRGLGYDRFLVDVGGELKALGARRDGRAWRIGIERPDGVQSGLFGTVDLDGEAVATSGDWRNFYEEGGVRYAHIIDPRTGEPVPFRGSSVTVLHVRGAEADAWATALSVLGPVEGFELAGREGVAALFVFKGAGGLESRATPGMTGRFVPRTEGDR